MVKPIHIILNYSNSGKIKCYIDKDRVLYKGFVFTDKDVFYSKITVFYNGTDFTGNKYLNVTKHFSEDKDVLDVVEYLIETLKRQSNLINISQSLIPTILLIHEKTNPIIIQSILKRQYLFVFLEYQFNYYIYNLTEEKEILNQIKKKNETINFYKSHRDMFYRKFNYI